MQMRKHRCPRPRTRPGHSPTRAPSAPTHRPSHLPTFPPSHPARARAFTLIEFIVVMTIIGILAALIVPRFVGRIGGAKQAVAQQKIHVLEGKVLEFQADCERFPTTQEGLRALLRAPADVSDKWRGPYVKEKDIIDPWGAELMYSYPGRYNADFDLFTYGADGQEGGEGENADLGNW